MALTALAGCDVAGGGGGGSTSTDTGGTSATGGTTATGGATASGGTGGDTGGTTTSSGGTGGDTGGTTTSSGGTGGTTTSSGGTGGDTGGTGGSTSTTTSSTTTTTSSTTTTTTPGACTPGQQQCAGNTPQLCDLNGMWADGAPCGALGCKAGACAACVTGDVHCSGDEALTCDANGQWQSTIDCGDTGDECENGDCFARGTCSALVNNCGPMANESCCASTVVPGGSYYRNHHASGIYFNSLAFPATVSDFRLDRFEVTTGRFRAFVDAGYGTQQKPPPAGSGAHPLIGGSGWDSAWNSLLSADTAALRAATGLSSVPGPDEDMPMGNLSWYDAFAFCAWDGGRLPTQAELSYAQSGGSEQRVYPWSVPPSSTVYDQTYGAFFVSFQMATAPGPVGHWSPRGDGKWGHADLAGNRSEWVLDYQIMPQYSYLVPCVDCANLVPDPQIALRMREGGNYAYDYLNVSNGADAYSGPQLHAGVNGVRCARAVGTCVPGEQQCAGSVPQTCDASGHWQSGVACANQACSAGMCVGVCAPGQTDCSGNTPRTCGLDGQWYLEPTCVGKTCYQGSCWGLCEPGDTQCSGNQVQTCGPTGYFDSGTTCVNQTCQWGACTGVCAPGQKQCSGNMPQHCGSGGQWVNDIACNPGVCVGGNCTLCTPGQKQCSGSVTQLCDAGGNWINQVNCAASGQICQNGLCYVPGACNGLPDSCGPNANESCCTSLLVPGGTYYRENDADGSLYSSTDYPATVSDFKLDRFEVTVGRFRAFADAGYGTQQNPPAAGAGAHPAIPGSGWDPAWSTTLPFNTYALRAEVDLSDNPGPDENMPMRNVTWYLAFAFCAWDGGRLPTQAEMSYAQAGGSEQRVYPWSVPPSSTALDSTYAVYWVSGPSVPPASVGSRSPKGDGKWGHADLAGNAQEWVLDYYSAAGGLLMPCVDCARLVDVDGTGARIHEGGGVMSVSGKLMSAAQGDAGATIIFPGLGLRCARAP